MTVDLSGNELDAIPLNLPSSLLGFSVSYNKLSNVLKFPQINSLMNLLELNLSHNYLTE